MSVTAGALSQVSVTGNKAVLSSAAATGGTGPYTYQWYMSTTTGFSPGGGNILSGETSLSLSKSGLVPNSVYYFKVVATDTGASNATSTSSQLAVTTTGMILNQNQFGINAIVGMLDLNFNYDTLSAMIDSSQSGYVYPGQAVKIVDSAGGVPKVVACDAVADDVFGFINYDVKSPAFAAGMAVEISQAGNCMYLYAAGAIARGAQVELNLGTVATVKTKTGSSGADLVGYAFDKASASGDLIRVMLRNPSFAKA